MSVELIDDTVNQHPTKWHKNDTFKAFNKDNPKKFLVGRIIKTRHETFGNGVTFVPLYNTFTDDEHIWHYKIAFDANALMESIYQKFDTVEKVDTVIEVTHQHFCILRHPNLQRDCEIN